MFKKQARVLVWLWAVSLTQFTSPVSPVLAEPTGPQSTQRNGSQLSPRRGHPPLEAAVRRQKSRQEYIQIESLIDSLNIEPGMTILDIGAGPGYASFLVAEKLNSTGEVFATDIRKDFVEYINHEAKRRGLTNLVAATVNENGLDEFYTQHKYDLVLLSNVYHCIGGRIAYFSEFRRFLRPNARLVLILSNQVPLLGPDDFLDVWGVANILDSEGDEGPFFKKLSKKTRQLLRGKDDGAALKSALVDDFNGMIEDPLFYTNFYSDSYFTKDLFSSQERDLANWLLMTLEEEGVLGQAIEQIDAKTMRTVRKLNRMFVSKRFGDYMANGGGGAYLPAGDANRHTSKYVMFRELGEAGYERSKEVELSPYFDAVIMVPRER